MSEIRDVLERLEKGIDDMKTLVNSHVVITKSVRDDVEKCKDDICIMAQKEKEHRKLSILFRSEIEDRKLVELNHLHLR